jgi:hypothetical protein
VLCASVRPWSAAPPWSVTIDININITSAAGAQVVILSSQKTLPVAVTVISFLDDSWQLGIIVIPCIICHLTQLLMDSVVASRWAHFTAEGGPLGLGARQQEYKPADKAAVGV